jgi:glycosyltransferase involved in cell wall biosynthesis
MPKLSLCLIAKDEKDFIIDCLRSVEGLVNEVCLVDTGSTDGTQDIFLNYETKMTKQFKEIEWENDFSHARNESLKLATGDWVLVLDCDERLVRESKSLIRKLMDYPPAIYQVLLQNEVDGDMVEHYLPRLFPNDSELFYIYPVHEQLVSEKEIYPAMRCPEVKILHLGYNASVIQGRNKSERNKQLLLKAVESDPNNPYYQFQLGQIYTIMGDDQSAIRHLDRCLALAGADTKADYVVSTYHMLFSIAINDKRPDIAEAVMLKGQEVCSHNPDYWVNYGSFLCSQGRLSESIAAYEKAVLLGDVIAFASAYDAGSTNWKPYLGIAKAYYASNDYITAYTYALEAFKYNQHDRIIEFMREIEPYLERHLEKAQNTQFVRA